MITATDTAQATYSNDKIAGVYMKKYEKAKSLRENFVDLFEECYEYALPQRESFTMKQLDKDAMIKYLTKLRLSVSKNLHRAYSKVLFLILHAGQTLELALKSLTNRVKALITSWTK